MALPYPILNAGGAVVVDSAKASQIAWNSVHENLDRANAQMQKKQETLDSDFDKMSELAQRASVLDEEEVNGMLVENKKWYAEQLGKYRNPNSPKFIAEFNQRLLDTEGMYGKAAGGQKAFIDNTKLISDISGYWNKGKMQTELIANRALPLSERNANPLDTILDDPTNYDYDSKMTDVSDVFRKGLTTEVRGYKKGGDQYQFAQTFNPAVHEVYVKDDGTNGIRYELQPEAYDALIKEDDGLRKNVEGKVNVQMDAIKQKSEDLIERANAGEVIPAEDQLTEWEQEFANAGGPRKGAMLLTQEMKRRVGFSLKDELVGATEDSKQKNRIELERIRANNSARLAQTKAEITGDTEGDKKRAELVTAQNNAYENIATGKNPAATIEGMLKEKESGGGVVTGSVRTERMGDGTMKITHRVKSVNDFKYKNIEVEKTQYVDLNSRGSVINAINSIGDNGWLTESDTDAKELPVEESREFGLQLKPGVTQKDGKFFDSQGNEITNIDEKADSGGVSEANKI